jgi:2-hydroxychromene-2-carboxylate isomerase
VTVNATPEDQRLGLAPLDEKVDHVRGPAAGRLIIEYGDYECPYSRQAFHAIERVEQQLGGNMRFAFRHFPLTGIHPHALTAAAAAEAAARQGRFWDMHELLFHRQKALEDADLLSYAARLGLDVTAFDRDRASGAVAGRIRRDVDSGLASGQVLGTPTLFIDGVVHRGYDPAALLAALAQLAALPLWGKSRSGVSFLSSSRSRPSASTSARTPYKADWSRSPVSMVWAPWRCGIRAGNADSAVAPIAGALDGRSSRTAGRAGQFPLEPGPVRLIDLPRAGHQAHDGRARPASAPPGP